MKNNVKSLTAIMAATLLLGGAGLMLANADDAFAATYTTGWEYQNIPSSTTMYAGDNLALTIYANEEEGYYDVGWGVSSGHPGGASIPSWITVSNFSTKITASNIPVGTYQIPHWCESEGGLLTGYLTLKILEPLFEIPYTAPSGNAIANTNWTYTPTTVSGVTLTVTGVNWLSVSGNMIYGVPPAAGTYDITVKMVKSGYADRTEMFTLTVVSELVLMNSPSIGVITISK